MAGQFIFAAQKKIVKRRKFGSHIAFSTLKSYQEFSVYDVLRYC